MLKNGEQMLNIIESINDQFVNLDLSRYISKDFESIGTDANYGLWSFCTKDATWLLVWMINVQIENKMPVSESVNISVFKTHRYNFASTLIKTFVLVVERDIEEFCEYINSCE